MRKKYIMAPGPTPIPAEVLAEASMPIMTRANGQYAFIMLYNIVYGFTWGPMPWLLPAGKASTTSERSLELTSHAEIFPLRGRSKGMALGKCFVIGMTRCWR